MSTISSHHSYGNGYISLVTVRLGELSEKISIDGYELLRKAEFHVSLICAKKIAPLIDQNRAEEIEAEIVAFFKAFIEHTPLSDYSLTDQFRLVKRDERVTLIAMVAVPGIEDLFAQLEDKYSVQLPLQPTHITLYTLQPEVGIGILSSDELERDSKVVEITLDISTL